MKYLNDIDDIYKNIEEYIPGNERKRLILFDDVIADMLSNKKLNSIVAELFIRGRKLNISLASITQSNLILLYPKILDFALHSILLLKFQTNESFNKSHLINYLIVTMKNLCNFTKNVLQNHIQFY